MKPVRSIFFDRRDQLKKCGGTDLSPTAIGTYGFLGQLDSRPSSQIILQAITTEARQQMIFRQFQGLPAMPEWCVSLLAYSHPCIELR